MIPTCCQLPAMICSTRMKPRPQSECLELSVMRSGLVNGRGPAYKGGKMIRIERGITAHGTGTDMSHAAEFERITIDSASN
jgi:hypothetical protein